MQSVNELIKNRLSEFPKKIASICEDILKSASTLPERALEARLEELVRKAVRREGEKK